MKLTPKEERFVEFYMGEAAGNGAKAAEMAGYAKHSARITASKMLRKPNVQEAVANRRLQIEKAAAEAAEAARVAHEAVERVKIADATERREILSGLLRDAKTGTDARIRAADVLNKMDGLYVTKLGAVGADGKTLGPRRVIIELDDAGSGR